MNNVSRKSQVESRKFLEKIIMAKKEDLKSYRIRKQKIGIKEKKSVIRNSLFVLPENKVAIIAEVKFASPTSPDLGSPKDLLDRVKQYEQAGADAISFITEKNYFKGGKKFIPQIKKAVTIPVLQKDFVIDPTQIYEAKELGSDALLLIARLVDKKTLKHFVDLCLELHIEPVVEINSEEDLKKAVTTRTNIIAVNARDLETFVVDVEKACKLMKKIPDRFLKLGFSGINTNKEVSLYRKAGARGVLVGTSLMQAKNIKGFISSLRGDSQNKTTKQSHAGDRRALRARDDAHVQVKICATRSLEAAQTAAESGAEFLGMVFTPHTRSHTIDRDIAKKIGKKMRGKINIVGVFQNMPLEEVQDIIKACNLDFAQFHGDETPEYISQIKVKVIKAFRFPGTVNLRQARKQMKQFSVDYYLVDRIKQSEGPMLDLKKVKILAKEFPIIFAGGLNPGNVAEVIHSVKPMMVDVASGIETEGKQDLQKIRQFVKNAKGVNL